MRVLVTLLAVAGLVCPLLAAAQPVPLQESAFTEYIAQRMKAVAAGSKVEVTVTGALEIKLKAPGDLSADAYLDRLHGHCKAMKGQCADAIRQYVQSSTQTFVEQAMPLRRQMLRTVARPDEYVRQVSEARKQKKGPPPLVAKPYVGGLWMVLAIDLPSSIRLATESDLKDLGLSEADAFAEGLRNVRETRPPILRAAQRLPGMQFSFLGEDDYESSRFLMHADWAEVARSHGGELIVSVPATNTVLFGRGGKEQTRALMALAEQEAARAQRKVSEQVFRWSAEGWQPVQR